MDRTEEDSSPVPADTRTGLSDIPVEVLCSILIYLPPVVIGKLGMTNKSIRSVVYDRQMDFVWRTVALKYLGSGKFKDPKRLWSSYCTVPCKKLRKFHVALRNPNRDLYDHCLRLLLHFVKEDYYKMLRDFIYSEETSRYLKAQRPEIFKGSQMECCRKGSLNCFKVLAEKLLVDLNYREQKKKGKSCIELAAVNRQFDIIQYIFTEFAYNQNTEHQFFSVNDINIHDLVSRCAKGGDTRILKLILDCYTSEIQPTEKFRKLNSAVSETSLRISSRPLTEAINANQYEMTEMLLNEYKADWDYVNPFETPIQKGYLQILYVFLDPNYPERRNHMIKVINRASTGLTLLPALISSSKPSKTKIQVLELIIPFMTGIGTYHDVLFEAAIKDLEVLEFFISYFQEHKTQIGEPYITKRSSNVLVCTVAEYGRAAREMFSFYDYKLETDQQLFETRKTAFHKIVAYNDAIGVRWLKNTLYTHLCPKLGAISPTKLRFGDCPFVSDEKLLEISQDVYTTIGDTWDDPMQGQLAFSNLLACFCFKTFFYFQDVVRNPKTTKNMARYGNVLFRCFIPPSRYTGVVKRSLQKWLNVTDLKKYSDEKILSLLTHPHSTISINEDDLLFMRDIDLLKLFLNSGLPYDINRITNKNSPLIDAIKYQSLDIIELFLKHKADPNILSINDNYSVRFLIYDKGLDDDGPRNILGKNLFWLVVFCKLIVYGLKPSEAMINKILEKLDERPSQNKHKFYTKCLRRIKNGQTLQDIAAEGLKKWEKENAEDKHLSPQQKHQISTKISNWIAAIPENNSNINNNNQALQWSEQQPSSEGTTNTKKRKRGNLGRK